MQYFANETGTTKTEQYFDKETEKKGVQRERETGKVGGTTL